jgi:hypothetical protein
MKQALWYAVDKDGVNGFYTEKPTRDPLSDSWITKGDYYDPQEGIFPGVELPEGLTWDDEPVEYEYEITIAKKP